MIILKPVIFVSISIIFIFVTNFIYAAEFSWKFNNGLPETRIESKELNRFADDVKNATDGGLNIKIYHGGSLGLKNNDVLRWLPTGAAEMGLLWANYLGRDAPVRSMQYTSKDRMVPHTSTSKQFQF